MTKPDDIPQDVWDAAIDALHTDWNDPALAMARTILAAKTEEREACACLAEGMRYGHLDLYAQEVARDRADDIAGAIRKRSPA